MRFRWPRRRGRWSISNDASLLHAPSKGSTERCLREKDFKKLIFQCVSKCALSGTSISFVFCASSTRLFPVCLRGRKYVAGALKEMGRKLVFLQLRSPFCRDSTASLVCIDHCETECSDSDLVIACCSYIVDPL